VGTIGLKVGADLVVVAWTARRLDILRRLAFFPLAELLLGAEVILSPLASLVPFEWKGRRYGRGGKIVGEEQDALPS
ncbi:MAG: hypothetical protein GXO73_08600, partial [Calditrichaeota bacterium]|nr:hypothetical protein [Calditrichota bacterium]